MSAENGNGELRQLLEVKIPRNAVQISTCAICPSPFELVLDSGSASPVRFICFVPITPTLWLLLNFLHAALTLHFNPFDRFPQTLI